MNSSTRLWAFLLIAALTAFLGAACSDAGPPGQPANVTPVDPATAATIAVQVSYAGTAPAAKEINMSAVAGCADLHAGPVYDPVVTVSNGRLAEAVVYIANGLGDRAFAFPTTPVQIDQKGCLYHPRVVALRVGQPLQFMNSDPEAHNVHGFPRIAKGWNFMMSQRNSTRTVYFTLPEVGVPVRCDVHPWMLAYVSAFAHPYFGVTGADGVVTLTDVPPGQYEVAVWHRELGTRKESVTLAPKAAARVELRYDAPA